MVFIRRMVRATCLLIHLLVGVILALLLTGLARMTYHTPYFQRTKQWWLKRLATCAGADLVIKGEPLTNQVLWVANHISWLDIGVLGGVGVPRFLSKIEVKKWPIIGWFATQSGTLYIDRGQSGERAAEEVRHALRQGDRVALFPEGTTTDGTTVKRFFARIFAPALDTETPVQPVVLQYKTMTGQRLDTLAYVGEQTLLDNIWAIIALPRFTAEVHFLPAITTQGMERKAIALQCEELIRAEVLKADRVF